MKIWAHTLFKNEERWLWFSVTSVIEHVDKLLLWDTGSTDRSWEIALALKEKYNDKIEIHQYGSVTSEEFPQARQAMLDKTEADWFLVVDADEIWWEASIKRVVDFIKSNNNPKIESVVVPNLNLVGDIFHYLPESAGNYTFKDKRGNYNLRAIKKIKGLSAFGPHGVMGWVDAEGRQIQDRKTFEFINAPYIHTTFLPRGENKTYDQKVPKRIKKLKYEIGLNFSKEFYYPESLFRYKLKFIHSPWRVMDIKYKLIAMFQTPLKKIKRRYFISKIGY